MGDSTRFGKRSIAVFKSFYGLGVALMLTTLISPLNLWGGQVAKTTEKGQNVFYFRLHLSEKKCQLAIWLADEKGTFVDTVYVTRSVAKKGLGNRRGGLDDKWGGARLSVLPVWAHSRGIDYGGGNFYPPKDKPLPDAITSATPKAGEFIWMWRPEKSIPQGKYFYYVEVNKSFDKNQHHNYSWYRGQPSVVWQGSLVVGNEISKGDAQIIGHGHPAGVDGRIESDVSTLTMALTYIKKIEAVYRPL